MTARLAEESVDSEIPPLAEEPSFPETVVVVDVGGKLFFSHFSTLSRAGYFRGLLRGGQFSRVDSLQCDGPFVDRSPELFEHVLSYLRDQRMDFDRITPLSFDRILQECDFYDVPLDPGHFEHVELCTACSKFYASPSIFGVRKQLHTGERPIHSPFRCAVNVDSGRDFSSGHDWWRGRALPHILECGEIVLGGRRTSYFYGMDPVFGQTVPADALDRIRNCLLKKKIEGTDPPEYEVSVYPTLVALWVSQYCHLEALDDEDDTDSEEEEGGDQ